MNEPDPLDPLVAELIAAWCHTYGVLYEGRRSWEQSGVLPEGADLVEDIAEAARRFRKMDKRLRRANKRVNAAMAAVRASDDVIIPEPVNLALSVIATYSEQHLTVITQITASAETTAAFYEMVGREFGGEFPWSDGAGESADGVGEQ